MELNLSTQWYRNKLRDKISLLSPLECSDFKECWSLNNLQPLWAEDNLTKSDKILDDDIV